MRHYLAQTVGKLGNKQSVWLKVGATLLVLALAMLGAVPQQTTQPAQFIAEGDGPKIGTGG